MRKGGVVLAYLGNVGEAAGQWRRRRSRKEAGFGGIDVRGER